MTEFPVRLERDVRADSPQQVYLAVAGLLREQGYSIRETEPAPADARAGGFRGGFRAIRDTVLDADKRRHGYLMLAAGGVITVIMLVVYALQLTDNRILASAPLLPAVILGGLGLGRLREPAQRIRRLVDTRFEVAGPGKLHLILLTGVGHAEGEDAVDGWIEQDEEPTLDVQRLDRVLQQFQAA